MTLGIAPIESQPTTSQHLSLQSFTLSYTVWPLFGQTGDRFRVIPNLAVWEVRGELGRSRVSPIESSPTTSQCHLIQVFVLSAAVWPKMVSIDMSFPHSYLTPIHTLGISCNVWPKHTMRQTDRRQIERSE